MAEYISREAAVDAGYLSDWYISSVGDEPPVWTDAHIDELLNDFIVIPKDTPAADVQPIIYAHKTINVGRRSYCSNCGELAIMEDFCSKCGAKVKDGDAEGKVAEQNIKASKPDGNCLDCKFQYLEDSDYWCSICSGNPEDI